MQDSVSREMFVVSLLFQNGGTGKTTPAIQLAVAAMLDGEVEKMNPQTKNGNILPRAFQTSPI